MTLEQAGLWRKIEAFELDVVGIRLAFTQRLARDNRWSIELASRAVGEYKKFVFLAACAGHPVTPSDQVDQVWHLHLAYTESYWKDLCGRILGFELHHGPTKGGAREGEKFRDWYSKTLESYQRFFGEAPSDLWPRGEARFTGADNWQRINTREYFLLPRSPLRYLLGMFGVFVFLFVLTGCEHSVSSLFQMSGSEFLQTYLVLLFVALFVSVIISVLFRRVSTRPMPPLTDYEAAYLLGGQRRAVDLALFRLVEKGLLKHNGVGGFSVTSLDKTEGLEPIENNVYKMASKGNCSYVSIGDAFLPAAQALRSMLIHKKLLLNERELATAKALIVLPLVLLSMVGAVRSVLGALRGHAVELLVCLVGVTIFFAYLGVKSLKPRTRLGSLAAKSFERRKSISTEAASHDQQVLLFGMGALVGTAYSEIGMLREQQKKKKRSNDDGYSDFGGDLLSTDFNLISDSDGDSGAGDSAGDSGPSGCGSSGCGGCGGGD